MMSNSNLAPVPVKRFCLPSLSQNGHQTEKENRAGGDARNRFDLALPVEIWQMILDHVDSSKDLLHASHASPIFNGILQEKKSTWLFEQVLPHVFKDFRKSDLMNLRLVCKSWNRAVDNYVAGHPSLQPFDEQVFRTVQSSLNYLPLSARVYDDIAFVNGEQFADFLRSMKNHPRNPFFGRSIRIGSCGDLFDYIDEAVENTWNGAAQLCEKFGSHLWHMEFANYEFSLSSLQFYKGVNRCLANLSNLKALHMNGALDVCDRDDGQLLEYMTTNPLPELPGLESIIFDLVMENDAQQAEFLQRRNRDFDLPEDPDVLVDYLQAHPEVIQQLLSELPPTPVHFQNQFIVSYGRQLRKLEIDLPSWRPEYGGILTNLTELHLKHVKSIPLLRSVIQGLQVGNGLGKLVISLRCSMKTSELFELLEPLRILYLDFGYLGEAPDDYLDDSSDEILPNISSLLLLRIKDTIDMTYEFLRRLPSLEHLDVWECQNARKRFHQQQRDANDAPQKNLPKKDSDPTNAIITDELRKLIYQEEDIERDEHEKSNIWKVLPSLKLVTYRTRSGLPSMIKRFARDSYSWEYICSF